jgi:hypothetical protein
VEIITAAELRRLVLPEPRWAVPGLIPEGVTILAGPPKVGKSWLALAAAWAVAHDALFEYIEIFYNRARMHASIGFISPAEARFENEAAA